MNFCVLIELSKKKISFLYNRSDGENKLTPFNDECQALPLAIFCQGNDIQIGQYAVNEALNKSPYAFTDIFNVMKTVGTYKYRGEEFHYNTLLFNAIQKYLSYFFDSVLIGQQGRLEQNVSNMPLCFMFNSDVNENERLFVRDCFEKGGYGNVANTDYDQLVIEASDYSTPNVICVTSDGSDLYVGIYKTVNAQHVTSLIIKDHGKDPRVDATVEKLWESIGYDSYYLDAEKERKVLLQVAENFLSSSDVEFQEKVMFTDGVSRECFVSKNQLDYIILRSDGKIISDIKNALARHGIEIKDCAVVLKGKAANNSYFDKIFKEEFSVKHVNDSFHSKVLKQLLADIKESNYRFTSENINGKPIVQIPQVTKTEISPTLKRIVKVKIADIKAKLRNGDRKGAKSIAEKLMTELHEQNVHDWDVEINSIMANMPLSEEKPMADPISQPEDTPIKEEIKVPISQVDPKKYQREVRTTIAEIKGKIRIKDYCTADSLLSSLESKLHKDGVFDYDDQFEEVKKEIVITPPIPIVKPRVEPKVKPQIDNVKTKTEVKATNKLSPAEKLLTQGKFADAKRAFASEGDSKMAQVCSDFIKSKRVIEQYKMGLEAAKRNKNRTTIANVLRDLEKYQKLYKQYNVEYNELEIIINNYKSI